MELRNAAQAADVPIELVALLPVQGYERLWEQIMARDEAVMQWRKG